jgi:hypothetical protein
MSRKLKFTIGKLTLEAVAFDTPTGDAILAALPLESRVATWGGEVYFPAAVKADREEDARDVVQAGELAFRPDGECLVIAYGPTPASKGDEIRLAADANIWGRVMGPLEGLAAVEPGAPVKVEIAE